MGLWVDETILHVLLHGTRLKTLPSRLGITELARLAADGGGPAGPSPLPSDAGIAIEVERMVNARGLAVSTHRASARHPGKWRGADVSGSG